MFKTFVVAGATAATIAAAGLAYAQQAPRGEAPRARAHAEDVSALADARIAGLKAGLKLTAEQEKNWPALEAAIRDMSRQRADRMSERAEARRERREARKEAREAGERPNRGDLIERMRRRAEVMDTRAASIKKLADAADPLYKSLDDGQKRRFAVLMRAGMRQGMGPGRHHGHGHHRGGR
jgi:zinc resistance-associated protein